MKSPKNRIAELERAIVHLADGIDRIQQTVKTDTKKVTYDKISDLLFQDKKVAETIESAYE